jgi:hypothetical protein
MKISFTQILILISIISLIFFAIIDISRGSFCSKCLFNPNKVKSARPSSSDGQATYDELTIYILVQDEIAAHLKAPSTAKFPDSGTKKSHVKSIGGGLYQINSWVDGSNSFGVPMRNSFTATVRVGSDSYQLVDINFY